MVEDILRTLGYLTLGSRLRRIGERLQSDTQRLLDTLDPPVPASQYPYLAALDRHGPLTVGELARAVGVSQPGATRTIGLLEAQGLVGAVPAGDDQRRRLVDLTDAGRRLVDAAKDTVWPRIAAAVEDLCGDLRGPLLEQLAAVEDGLDAMPLDRRAAADQGGRR
jgi:DNA-binding MarR family transcriptional regulator